MFQYFQSLVESLQLNFCWNKISFFNWSEELFYLLLRYKVFDEQRVYLTWISLFFLSKYILFEFWEVHIVFVQVFCEILFWMCTVLIMKSPIKFSSSENKSLRNCLTNHIRRWNQIFSFSWVTKTRIYHQYSLHLSWS